MHFWKQTVFAFSLVLLPIAIVLWAAIAYSQGGAPSPSVDLQTDQIMALWKALGWPGLIAGVVSSALGVWRFFAPRAWDSWPRWARYGLVVAAIGSAAAVASLVQAISGGTAITVALIIASIVKGLIAGATTIGVTEGVKTYKRPKAKRGHSYAVAIEGPDGTGVGGGRGK